MSCEDKTAHNINTKRWSYQFTLIKVWIMSGQAVWSSHWCSRIQWRYGTLWTPIPVPEIELVMCHVDPVVTSTAHLPTRDVLEVVELSLFPVRQPNGFVSRTERLNLTWSKWVRPAELPRFRMINRWKTMETQEVKISVRTVILSVWLIEEEGSTDLSEFI